MRELERIAELTHLPLSAGLALRIRQTAMAGTRGRRAAHGESGRPVGSVVDLHGLPAPETGEEILFIVKGGERDTTEFGSRGHDEVLDLGGGVWGGSGVGGVEGFIRVHLL